jgi:hypothetical protein
MNTTRRWRTATASVACVLLSVLLVLAAGCGVGGLFEEGESAEPAAAGEASRSQLEDAEQVTAAAGGGTIEVTDDMDGHLTRLTGTFQQDPPAMAAEQELGPAAGGSLVVVGRTLYSEQDGTWYDAGESTGDEAMREGGQPARMLAALLALDAEPAGIEPIDGATASYRWVVLAEEVGVIDDYEGAETVVDVAVDGEQRVIQVQVRVERLSNTLVGGSTTFDFAYEDVPPITAPEQSEPLIGTP